jgi:hypothetical protein
MGTWYGMKKPSDRAGRPRCHAAHGMSRTKPSASAREVPLYIGVQVPLLRAQAKCQVTGQRLLPSNVVQLGTSFLSALLLVDIRPCDRSNACELANGSERASARALPNSRVRAARP